MELSLVTDQWNPRGGGRERSLAALVAWLAVRGDRSHVLCLRDRSAGSPGSVASLTAVGHRGPLAERRLAAAIRRWQRAHPASPLLVARPQAEATHYQLRSGLYREAYAAERESLSNPFRRLLFWPALRLNPHRMARLAAERQLLSSASGARLMVFSRRLAATLCERFGVAADRVCVSPPGVDLQRFGVAAAGNTPSRPPPHGGLRLLFAGHNYGLKGLATAIGATARCRSTGIDAQLTIAGGGSLARARKLAVGAGIAPHVLLLGPVPQTELASLYRNSHALVHPSFYDPFGMVVIEALAAGCPVVTTRRCGAAEQMVDGVHGRVIESPDDVAEFAAGCCELAEPARWRQAHEAALALGRACHFDRHAADVREWLQS